jgi:hypothetical protein
MWPRAMLGGALAAGLLLGVTEVYLRQFPPGEHHAYLGEASPLTGIFLPDKDFGVTYRSWEAFYADNAERLRPFFPPRENPDSRRVWAFFGNSFVQAPGMLADRARELVGNRRVFNLGRNEHLFVRLAQIKLLLQKGFVPERIFVLLMPVDMLALGVQPLRTIYVTSQGALTYIPRLPGGVAGWLAEHSRLAKAAWFRAGYHRGNSGFRKRTLSERVQEPLLGDIRHLFSGLARVTREHGVPVTVILIPSYEQIMGRAGFGFQDTLGPLLRQQGYDVFDPRDAFGPKPERAALFLPDKHFTALGNQMVLSRLLAHLGTNGSAVPLPMQAYQP